MRACPVCRNISGAEILHTQKFVLPDSHPLPVLYDIIACDKCGFVYADTPATQDTYDIYYSEMSKYDMNYACADNLLYIERAAWIKKCITDKNAEIIDIGSGNGHLLLELKKSGFSALTALDPSPVCIEEIKRQGIKGTTGSIFDYSPSVKYDAVILSGVLEHIYDVARIMHTIKKIISSDGLLLLFVPDASRYHVYDTVPWDYFNIEHINHFDEVSLINLGFFHGFSMVDFFKTTVTFAELVQPMIFCALQNSGIVTKSWLEYSKNNVREYIARSEKNTRAVSIIDQLAATQEKIVVWGAGNYTNRLLADSSLGKCNITMFVDRDRHKQGMYISGRPVCAPVDILKGNGIETILVSAAVFHAEIVEEIKKMGLRNRVVVLK